MRSRTARRRGGLGAVLAATTLLLSTSSVAPERLALPESCLGRERDSLVLGGSQTARRDVDSGRGIVIDARTARWRGTLPYVIVATGGRTCLSGGTIRGEWPPDTPWDVTHSTGAVLVDSPDSTVEDLRVAGYGDSIRLTNDARQFLVRRVHLSDGRDDCIENDWLHAGVVRDAFLDGCYNAFSARPYGQEGVTPGRERVMRIEQSLVRLQPLLRPYGDRGEPGTAGFFKWDESAPQLELHGNVFRADQAAGTVGLDIPLERVAGCSHNVMVWLGPGRYPGTLPDCFSVTRDVGVWQRAVQRWERRTAR